MTYGQEEETNKDLDPQLLQNPPSTTLSMEPIYYKTRSTLLGAPLLLTKSLCPYDLN